MNNRISTPPAFISDYQSQIDQALKAIIAELTSSDATLGQAINYSTLLGGKRIRPILTLATAECFNISPEQAMPAACALELVHAYSLIHDDLPAMDDDDLRRGHPTCHKAYDEATAILAGDALQAMAYELLADAPQFSAAQRIKMISELARASGPRGMVLGQAVDFESVGQSLDIKQLEYMHRHKTGALIEASVMIGALCHTDTLESSDSAALRQYAQAIGLAFQVQDDILDITSDTQTLGKTQGADLALNKPTYPALLGLDGARDKLIALHKESLHALEQLEPRKTQKLAEISHYIVARIS